MLLYNTTFGIDRAIEKEFIDWLRSEFIPSATADGEYFTSPALFRVEAQNEPGATSLALHLRAASRTDIETWYADHGSRLFDELLQRWPSRAVFFSTTLSEIQ